MTIYCMLYLSNCVLLLLFLSHGRERGFIFPPSARYLYRSSCDLPCISSTPSPPLSHYHTMIHTVTPYSDTSRVPNSSRLQLFIWPSLRMVEYHLTPPIPRSFGLLSSGTGYRFVPHTVASSGCLSFPPLATPSLRDTLLASSMLFREYALYASDLHLPSLCITRSQMSPPATSVVAPPIRDECKANLSGLRPDSATTFLTARRVRPYHTTLTELPNRYEARGG